MTKNGSSGQALKEQRLHERFLMSLPVKVSPHNSNAQKFETVSANISSSGVLITTDKPLPIASKVDLEFYISIAELKKLKFILSLETLRKLEGKHTWVKTTGVVIRHQADGMAVIFDDDYQLSPLAGTAG